MNEKNIIKKVKSLRAIQPSTDDLIVVEKKIGRVQITKRDTFWHNYLYAALGVLALILFTIFFISKTLWFQTELYQAQIFLTQSKYQKAKLSLQLSQKELVFVKENKNDTNAINNLIATINTTNTYFSHLNLHGEPGKYSKEQCQSLYLSFARYLDNTKETIKMNDTASDMPDKKIEPIEKQVDARLKTYQK